MLEFAEVQHTDRETLFVEVILPLAIAKNYTYRVPFQMNEAVADRQTCSGAVWQKQTIYRYYCFHRSPGSGKVRGQIFNGGAG